MEISHSFQGDNRNDGTKVPFGVLLLRAAGSATGPA